MSWNERAACRGMNVDIFVSPTFTRTRHPDYTTARAICDRCEVTDACLAASGNALGMWGGLDEAERAGRKRPRRGPTTRDRIVATLEGWMSTRQVADRVKLTESTVRQALLALHRDGKVARSTRAGYAVWTLR